MCAIRDGRADMEGDGMLEARSRAVPGIASRLPTGLDTPGWGIALQYSRPLPQGQRREA